MNRITVAVLAALESLIVVAIGIGVALVPLTILWAAQFHMAVDWSIFWRAAGDIWLVGHGVDLHIALDSVTTATLGIPDAGKPFSITVAVLGFALLAVLMGVRAGMRTTRSEHPWIGGVVAVIVYGALGWLIGATVAGPVADPVGWQTTILPGLVFAIGIGIGILVETARYRQQWGPVERISTVTRRGIGAALRAGTTASALIFAASAVFVTVLLVSRFGTVVGLYEGLQAGALGALSLTIIQLALLPNAVIWTSSWLIGPGFALGTGSSVSPFGTELGPVPGIPFVGIVPDGDLSFGFVALLVPALAGFVAAWLTRRHLEVASLGIPTAARLAMIAVGAGIVAGIQMGLLTWFSAGAVGPGRLVDVGPNPVVVGAATALMVCVASLLGIFAANHRH